MYYNYRSKMDILLAVYELGMAHLEERMLHALTELPAANAADRLRAVCLGHVHNIMQHFTFHVVIQNSVEHRRQMALRDTDRDHLAVLDDTRARHEAFVQALIASSTARSARLPHGWLRVLLGGIVGVAIWYRPREDQDDEERREIAAQVVDLLLGGLVTTSAPSVETD